MIQTKIVSSLSRAFTDNTLGDFNRLKKISALRGERVSFQLLTYFTKSSDRDDIFMQRRLLIPKISGALCEYVTLREVKNVAIELPVIPENCDEHYERTAPGLYPDVLCDLHFGGKIISKANMLSSTWIDITIPDNTDLAGESELKIELYAEDGVKEAEDAIHIDVINAALPEQTLYFTQWFHCDCLASYYNVDVWSEEHWRIVENFARVAKKNGINLLLTPTFTPPLDTAVGGERLTTQLVGVTVNRGKYSFDFSLLDRWVDMCDRVGIKYLEIAHFFTQWGAKNAPKIMATVDGEYKKIFGWETDALGEEYVTFLRTFITEFLLHMKKNGNDKRCMFHISDEPQLEHLETYSKVKANISDLLEGYIIMDALSNYDFWDQKIVDVPIPANNHIKPFIENNVPNLWTYYCCGQCIKVSNRLIAMPSWRNRSIGMQMYKYDIVGFLHWGYNFYNNQYSVDEITSPYTDLSGDHWVPAGDTFSVYPTTNGEALESLRIVVFHDALQDISAMKLCEQYYPKEQIVSEIEAILGDTLTFDRCAYDEGTMLAIREKINAMIKAKI